MAQMLIKAFQDQEFFLKIYGDGLIPFETHGVLYDFSLFIIILMEDFIKISYNSLSKFMRFLLYMLHVRVTLLM